MRKLLTLAVLASCAITPAGARAGATSPGAHTVLALIDTGINPYSPAFRDCSPEATQYSGTYIPGYPQLDDVEHSAVELDLTLVPCPGDPPQPSMTYAQRVAKDAAEWDKVFSGLLYWIPGTKIIGATSVGPGTSDCHTVPDVPPAGGVANGLACKDNKILDDFGHGTMTASRSAGHIHSLPANFGFDTKIVEVEGTGALGVNWVASQPWIDVVSNSWGSAVPGPSDVSAALKSAVNNELWLFASGNGLGFTNGFAPQPTEADPTGVAGVVIVGAHDNGHVAAWSEAPAHVVADGYGGWTGLMQSVDEEHPDPESCCTSAAAPYAAGGAAAILHEARSLVGDTGTGVRDGNIVVGVPHPELGSSPLADGVLTLVEFKDLFLHTAEAVPAEGADDGLMQFMGGPGSPQHPEYGLGENPFCEGCWTLPVKWSDVPGNVPSYTDIGYGAINERSVTLAFRVLQGAAAMPSRPDVDAWYQQDQAVRQQIFGP